MPISACAGIDFVRKICRNSARLPGLSLVGAHFDDHRVPLRPCSLGGQGGFKFRPLPAACRYTPRLRAGHSQLFDQFAEMNQLGFRIMRRCNLDPDRQTVGAAPCGDDERRISAGVVDGHERHRVVEIAERSSFQLDRSVLLIVKKGWARGDRTDDEIVVVEPSLQVSNQVHASSEGSTEFLEPEIEPCLHVAQHVDAGSSRPCR